MKPTYLLFYEINILGLVKAMKNFSITTLLFLLFFSTKINAQTISGLNSNKGKEKSSEWQLLIDNDIVSVSYRYEDCNFIHDGIFTENVYLLVQNKTSKKIKCNWISENWYNDKCNNCEISNIENGKVLVLNPNEKTQGFCSLESNRALVIFSKSLNRESKYNLTDFNLGNFKVAYVTE
ncbi:MAG: hypothetical protein V4548_04770 [Bacteroidota bacterium]